MIPYNLRQLKDHKSTVFLKLRAVKLLKTIGAGFNIKLQYSMLNGYLPKNKKKNDANNFKSIKCISR